MNNTNIKVYMVFWIFRTIPTIQYQKRLSNIKYSFMIIYFVMTVTAHKPRLTVHTVMCCAAISNEQGTGGMICNIK